jgi:hypothetical protein
VSFWWTSSGVDSNAAHPAINIRTNPNSETFFICIGIMTPLSVSVAIAFIRERPEEVRPGGKTADHKAPQHDHHSIHTAG